MGKARNPVKRRRWRKQRTGFEDAARLAAPKSRELSCRDGEQGNDAGRAFSDRQKRVKHSLRRAPARNHVGLPKFPSQPSVILWITVPQSFHKCTKFCTKWPVSAPDPPCFWVILLKILTELALPVEKAVENLSQRLSGSDPKSCHADLNSCKDDSAPCRTPVSKPSSLPVFRHIHSPKWLFFSNLSRFFKTKYFFKISPRNPLIDILRYLTDRHNRLLAGGGMLY